MDSKISVTRALPPLVDGKVHGKLEFVIDEIVWTHRCPGNILINAVWWGELDNAQFRLGTRKDKEHLSKKDFSQIYLIKTNFDLFREYLKNADSIELLILSEKSQHIIGTAHVTKLLNLFPGKPFSQSCPILNSIGSKIGEIYVRINLTITKNSKNLRLTIESKKKSSKVDKPSFEIPLMPRTMQSVISPSPKQQIKHLQSFDNFPLKLENIDDNDHIYRSILKDKRSGFCNFTPKCSIDVTDKLVAQVVARARKLRGAITNGISINTKNGEDLLVDDTSISDSFCSNESAKKEATLYEYFMGKQMSLRSEKNALETLRTLSPTPSLIDFAAETIKSCNENNPEMIEKVKNMHLYDDFHSGHLEDNLESDSEPSSNKICLHSKEACPLDYVDSVRITVDSLILSPAGYRRVKSTSISGNDGLPISVTYFVQYDTMFATMKNLNKNNKKIINGKKLVKICSKKQEDLIVYFNHEGVYDLSKQYLHTGMPLKFKIFNRHINQRTPTELGVGSMYISDASKSSFLSSTQKVAIVKKGIKIAELKVKIELGCDRIHFGRQFVEAVSSTKENIPVLELSNDSVSDKHTSSLRYKTIVGSESKSGNKENVSTDRKEKTKTSSDQTKINKKDIHHKKHDDLSLEVQPPSNSKEKILLHGLIYIGDGKDLPEMSTYLICRAFWREDRSISRVCSGTVNPFYHFHQLVPLIHGPELLERTKDNCIITEIYSKNVGSDDKLIGIAKLSVHQLYVAFRDPLVLPHLLKSKYPIISVDGWVSITDPVTGRIQGQLSALVALGTADQIALLEMTRGLRDPYAIAQTSSSSTRNNSLSPKDDYIHTEELQKHYPERFYQHCNQDELREKKSQECQTEITTVSDFKRQATENLEYNREDSNGLQAIDSRLTQTLTAPRIMVDQQTQLEPNYSSFNSREHMKVCSVEPLCLEGINSNNYSIESSDGSPRDTFTMPREIFRSVGVGAEFDEEVDQATNHITYNVRNDDNNVVQPPFDTDNNLRSFDTEKNLNTYDYKRKLQSTEKHSLNDDVNEKEEGFRATVDICCAVHLPKVDKDNQFIEPCTYVTFQKLRDNTRNKINAYMITDVCPFNCNPKYDWHCDIKLSNDYLTKQDKKFVMKVWRLIDPDISMEVNLDKDIVIGSIELDLTVLTAGFPVVSGWFHIVDHTGKCNGQLQVNIAPLDNITMFKKSVTIISGTTSMPSFNNTNVSPLHFENMPQINDSNLINEPQNIGQVNQTKSQAEIEPMIDMNLGLEDISMSFLSQSLKQKLSELDEIKQRLQSRLQDVTNTAFDDFENDFDFEDHEDDHENNHKNDEKNDNEVDNLQKSVSWSSQSPNNHSIDYKTNGNQVLNGNQCLNNENNHDYLLQSSNESNTNTLEVNIPDTGYSSSSNNRTSQTLINGNIYKDNSNPSLYSKSSKMPLINYQQSYQTDSTIENYHNEDTNVQNFNSNSNSSFLPSENQLNEADYPIRGTRIHINHLLDKLSTQLTSAPPPITNLPMKRNIMDLISSLRRNNNNFSNNVKCNREANVRTVPTQTDVNYVSDCRQNNSLNNTTFHERDHRRDDTETPAKTQRREKVSAIIREELIADDHNNTTEYDCLSTQLITSNVRHTGFDEFNPLLYSHMIPDISTLENESPEIHQNLHQESNPSLNLENDTVERLDNQYVETFNATINKGLKRLKDQSRTESTSGTIPPACQELIENTEIFSVTPSGVSENIDGNIDVTVIHRPCNDDLMASNSVESTTTTSTDNNPQILTEIDDDSSLNSSETSVFAISRQAPDGGNPIEDINGSSIPKPNSQSTDFSFTES